MRISCEHHHPKSHISQGYLATELQSPGAGGRARQREVRSGTPQGPGAPRSYRTQHWALHPCFVIGKLRLKEVTQQLK